MPTQLCTKLDDEAIKCLFCCEGHATARQYLSSLGLGPCHPSKASIAAHIQIRTRLSMAISPGRLIPILSKTQLLPAMTSLLLGTDTEASLLPDSNANPRGFHIVPHNPADNFLPVKAFL